MELIGGGEVPGANRRRSIGVSWSGNQRGASTQSGEKAQMLQQGGKLVDGSLQKEEDAWG